MAISPETRQRVINDAIDIGQAFVAGGSENGALFRVLRDQVEDDLRSKNEPFDQRELDEIVGDIMAALSTEAQLLANEQLLLSSLSEETVTNKWEQIAPHLDFATVELIESAMERIVQQLKGISQFVDENIVISLVDSLVEAEFQTGRIRVELDVDLHQAIVEYIMTQLRAEKMNLYQEPLHVN